MKCRTCECEKDLTEFPVQRSVTNFRGIGVPTVRKDCKVCTAAAARNFRKQNPGYSGSGKVTKYAVEVRPVVSACAQRVQDAKARSKGEFNIDTDYMYAKLLEQGGRCALSGILLSVEKHTHHVLSIDQILPGLGYTRGNVQWVSWAVNRAKGDLSLADFHTMCRAILGRCNDYPEREYGQVAGSA